MADKSSEEDLRNNTQASKVSFIKSVLGADNDSLDVEQLRSDVRFVFAEGGLFSSKLKNYAPRQGQIDLADTVSQSLGAEKQILMVEAGTGTGKTFSYLVPPIVAGKRIIVSTGTKALQDQLVDKDIPNLLKILDRQDLLFMGLKGHSNYVCRYMLDELDNGHNQYGAKQDLDRLMGYVEECVDNMEDYFDHRSDVGVAPNFAELKIKMREDQRKLVSCDSNTCQKYRKECPFVRQSKDKKLEIKEECFITAARKYAQQCSVITINHALFFASLGVSRPVFQNPNQPPVAGGSNAGNGAANQNKDTPQGKIYLVHPNQIEETISIALAYRKDEVKVSGAGKKSKISRKGKAQAKANPYPADELYDSGVNANDIKGLVEDLNYYFGGPKLDQNASNSSDPSSEEAFDYYGEAEAREFAKEAVKQRAAANKTAQVGADAGSKEKVINVSDIFAILSKQRGEAAQGDESKFTQHSEPSMQGQSASIHYGVAGHHSANSSDFEPFQPNQIMSDPLVAPVSKATRNASGTSTSSYYGESEYSSDLVQDVKVDSHLSYNQYGMGLEGRAGQGAGGDSASASNLASASSATALESPSRTKKRQSRKPTAAQSSAENVFQGDPASGKQRLVDPSELQDLDLGYDSPADFAPNNTQQAETVDQDSNALERENDLFSSEEDELNLPDIGGESSERVMNLLPKPDVLVFDEAHTVPEVGRSFYTRRYNRQQLSEFVKDLKKELGNIPNYTQTNEVKASFYAIEESISALDLIFRSLPPKRYDILEFKYIHADGTNYVKVQKSLMDQLSLESSDDADGADSTSQSSKNKQSWLLVAEQDWEIPAETLLTALELDSSTSITVKGKRASKKLRSKSSAKSESTKLYIDYNPDSNNNQPVKTRRPKNSKYIINGRDSFEVLDALEQNGPSSIQQKPSLVGAGQSQGYVHQQGNQVPVQNQSFAPFQGQYQNGGSPDASHGPLFNQFVQYAQPAPQMMQAMPQSQYAPMPQSGVQPSIGAAPMMQGGPAPQIPQQPMSQQPNFGQFNGGQVPATYQQQAMPQQAPMQLQQGFQPNFNGNQQGGGQNFFHAQPPAMSQMHQIQPQPNQPNYQPNGYAPFNQQQGMHPNRPNGVSNGQEFQGGVNPQGNFAHPFQVEPNFNRPQVAHDAGFNHAQTGHFAPNGPMEGQQSGFNQAYSSRPDQGSNQGLMPNQVHMPNQGRAVSSFNGQGPSQNHGQAPHHVNGAFVPQYGVASGKQSLFNQASFEQSSAQVPVFQVNGVYGQQSQGNTQPPAQPAGGYQGQPFVRQQSEGASAVYQVVGRRSSQDTAMTPNTNSFGPQVQSVKAQSLNPSWNGQQGFMNSQSQGVKASGGRRTNSTAKTTSSGNVGSSFSNNAFKSKKGGTYQSKYKYTDEPEVVYEEEQGHPKVNHDFRRILVKMALGLQKLRDFTESLREKSNESEVSSVKTYIENMLSFITDLMTTDRDKYGNLRDEYVAWITVQEPHHNKGDLTEEENRAAVARLEAKSQQSFIAGYSPAVKEDRHRRNKQPEPEPVENDFEINLAPIEIGRFLGPEIKRLTQNGVSVVFASATITTSQDFQKFCYDLGLGLEDVTTKIVESPFNYAQNARIMYSKDFLDIYTENRMRRHMEMLKGVIDASPGGVFFLTTSYEAVSEAQAECTRLFANTRKLYVQGTDSVNNIMDAFRKDGHGILIGTSSFWEGVDVPGQALSLVIIDKLPFKMFNDPVNKARAELCRRQGKNPFYTISVPETIIKLRQGVGRLIRNEKDLGGLIILDPRIETKKYGDEFLASLPPMTRVKSLEDIIEFFGKIRAQQNLGQL